VAVMAFHDGERRTSVYLVDIWSPESPVAFPDFRTAAATTSTRGFGDWRQKAHGICPVSNSPML
jgi:hypothetical protein